MASGFSLVSSTALGFPGEGLAVVKQGLLAGRVPGLSEPYDEGWRTHCRPYEKSGGHGVGWSPIIPYSFSVPTDWNEVPVSIADLGGTEIDLRFANPKEGRLSVIVAHVLRFADSAAQSLGSGAILVNPWNITEVAASIGHDLNMLPEEREKRHRHNFHHVKTHTAQEWAETFVSELNDTVIEAQLRISKVPPELPQHDAIRRYSHSNNRLLILGFNATLTEPVDNLGRRGDQIKEMDLNLHPELKGPLTALCSDPSTTIVVLSGSSRSVLDKVIYIL